MEPRPWPSNQLKKLSVNIRDERPEDPNLPAYADVMLWYNELAAEVQKKIAALDWEPLLQGRSFEVTSRPKTIDTLRQKLQRDHSTPLGNVQDIAGVRFEAEMSLDEQDAVAQAIAQLFDHDPALCIHDLRGNPSSGYRAVHVWLKLAGRVEVQVRTHIQSEWANTYEAAADVLGRDIRYGKYPDFAQGEQLVKALQELSVTQLAQVERQRNRIDKLRLEHAEVDQRFGGLASRRGNRSDASIKEMSEQHQVSEKFISDSMKKLRETFDELRNSGEV